MARSYGRERLAGLLMTLVFCAPHANAFHENGVASCAGCHVMHEMEDGMPVVDVSGSLLRGLSPSDACLACHGSGDQAVFGYDPMNPPTEMGGGNFAFLREDQINDDPQNNAPSISGNHAGHSIVAPGYGLTADPDHTLSPGGTFPANELGCTSCHDPHGNSNFRMLNGAGPVQDGLFAFLYAAPEAEGLPVGLSGGGETTTSHTAYRSGMSWWCANCHGQYHDQVGRANFEHEFNEGLSGEEAGRYNSYNGDADPNGGSSLTSYLVQVPFEDPAGTIDKMSGPGSGARVMCLTCHRAHATSAPSSTRWDMRIPALGTDGVKSRSWPLPNPYANPSQRQLCLKCHDEHHGTQSSQSCFTCHQRHN